MVITIIIIIIIIIIMTVHMYGCHIATTTRGIVHDPGALRNSLKKLN